MRKDTQTHRQEAEYAMPYHHLVSFDEFRSYAVAYSGLEYYGYMSFILKKIESLNYDSLLDIGCGDGKMIYELSRKGSSARLVGTDLSEKAIYFARAFNQGNGAQFFNCDAAEINEQFDVVTAIETMEHVHDQDILDFVETVFKRLKPKGYFVVSVPTTNFPLHKKHYRHYTKSILEEQLSDLFEIKETFYLVKEGWLEYLLLRINAKLLTFKLVNKLVFLFANKFLFSATKKTGRHMVAVCVKKQKESDKNF